MRPFSPIVWLAAGVALVLGAFWLQRTRPAGPRNNAPPAQVPPAASASSEEAAARSQPRADYARSAAEYQLDAPRRRDKLGRALAFRTTSLNSKTAKSLEQAQQGDLVTLDLFPDVRLQAHVTGRWDDESGLRVAARLDGQSERDRLFMSWAKDSTRGLVEIPSRNIAYEILQTDAGGYTVKEWLFTDVVCSTPDTRGHSAESGIPKPEAGAMAAMQPMQGSSGQVPQLNSRPGAPSVIYLDFDGEVVTTTAWNNGNTIDAPPARMNASQIEETWRRVMRDFETFNVTVTTIRSVYDNAPQNRRTHCVITQNDAAAPGAGGVAYTYSFINGEAYKVCWVFIDDHAKYCAEAASHEVGHTFGLLHDGRTATATEGREEYYGGHGSGPTGWAPIMGVGYYQDLSQWSKGEYDRANNPEDDLAMISNYAPYNADDCGNSIAAATNSTGDRIDGVIENTSDTDFFKVTLNPGSYSVTVQPSDFSNLDTYLDVQRADGSSLGSTFPTGTLTATVSFTLQSAETIYLRVDGAGEGSATGSGYSKYSSLGAYSITGFGNQQQPPSAPVGVSTKRISGTQIRVSWTTNPSASSYLVYRDGVLVGTTATTQFLDTTVAPSTEYTYKIAAANQYGEGLQSSGTTVTTIGPDEFLMDGEPDFSGYLVSNSGMTIYASVRGTKLYVATWSPGDKNSGYNNDHFILVSDILLPSATTSAPWGKHGRIAIPGNKPYLAGESTTTYGSWFNTAGPKYHFKALLNSGVMEGVIDLVAEFGAMPANIYIAAVAYQTDDAYFYGSLDTFSGKLVSQTPAGNGNDDIEPGEFLCVPTRSLCDAAQNGSYDILDAARSFAVTNVSFATNGRTVLRWPVAPGRNYMVQGRSALDSGSWTNILDSAWAAGPTQWEMEFTDFSAATPAKYYRITQP